MMGYHHFHSDAAPHDHLRSDDVLFARVTRDTFTVIGVFNHAAFEATEADASMTDERTRLWQVFDEQLDARRAGFYGCRPVDDHYVGTSAVPRRRCRPTMHAS